MLVRYLYTRGRIMEKKDPGQNNQLRAYFHVSKSHKVLNPFTTPSDFWICLRHVYGALA